MMPTASIFLDFNIPNPTTWFYFSALLAVALFFKFSRLLSMRNLDVLTLFLFMPGLLLIAERGPHAFLGYLGLLAAPLPPAAPGPPPPLPLFPGPLPARPGAGAAAGAGRQPQLRRAGLADRGP